MDINQALKTVVAFKGNNLRVRLSELRNQIVLNTSTRGLLDDNVYEAAIIVKKISAQIDEVVHAVGIIRCLPKILAKNEKIESLSLAAGSEGEGFDLVTNKRIAEFKFSVWQEGNAANAMRKRQVFSDYINLLLADTTKAKELYVIGADKIKKYFDGRADWKKVLSKSGGLDLILEKYLSANNISGRTLKDVSAISRVKIIDINELMSN